MVIETWQDHEVKKTMERIQVDPNIHFGKPCVAGTRIPVQNIVELIREDIAFDKIIQDYYPELKIEDVRACIQYAIELLLAEDVHIAATAA
jgi:uncharacterized protein (DUF433 family)